MKQVQLLFKRVAVLLFISTIPLIAQPVLDLPAANATGVTKTPEFSWHVPTGTPLTTFWLQVATVNDFTVLGNLIYNLTSDNTAGTFFTPTLVSSSGGWDYYSFKPAVTAYSLPHQPLQDGTNYWWRVGYTTATFATSRQLTTIQVPTLIGPGNPTQGVLIGQCSNPVLQWNTVEGAAQYRIRLFVYNTGTATWDYVVNQNVPAAAYPGVQTFATTGVDSWGSQYRWYVRALDSDNNNTAFPPSLYFNLIGAPSLTAPGDLATCQPLGNTLTWNPVPGAVNYEIQVAKDPGFAPVDRLNWNTGYTSTTYVTTASRYSYNTTYYWRVRANNGSCDGGWSVTYSYTTELETPSLFSPGDVSTCVVLNPTLQWNAVAGAGVTYDVQVSTDGTFAGADIVENLNDVAGTSTATTNVLLNNHTYFWRVLSNDANCTSPWSAVWSFTTIQADPVLDSPDNGSCGLALNPTLTWNSVTGATEYELEVYNSSAALVHSSLQAGTSFVTTNCNLYNEVYSWHVRVTQPCVTGWSPTWTFETIIATPALVSPLNFQPGISLEPTFTWTDVAGETSYQVHVFSDALLTTPVYNSPALPANTTMFTVPYNEPSFLQNGSTYYWVVEAFKAGCSSTVALPWQFTTIDIVEPFLSYPTGCPELFTPTVFFSWYLNQPVPGVTYDLLVQLYVNTGDELMPAPTALATGLTTTTFSSASLLPGMTYYWRIRARSSSGVVAGYSTIDCFNTFGDPSLYPAIPSWPIGTYTPYAPAELYTTTPTLYWYLNGPQDGLVFDVQVYQELFPNPDGLVLQLFSIPDLYTGIPTGILQPGYDYFWQVQSRNPVTGEVSGFSTPEYFKVVGQTYTRVPIPSWPIDGNTVYTLSPTFYWYVDGPATGLTYDIIYTTNPADIVPAGPATISGISNLYTLPLAPLQAGTHYYWAVRSSNSLQTSAWSSVADFYTHGQVGNIIPVLTYPIDNETVYTLDPYLYWYVNGTGVVSFDVEVRNGALTGTPNYPGVTAQFLHIFGLLQGTQYNWSVRSFNGTGYSDWATPESFITFGGGVNNIAPVLTWPIGGPTLYTNTPTLNWFVNSTYTPISFTVAVYWDQNGLFPIPGSPFAAGVNTNSFDIPGGALVSGALYYWQVFASDGINPAQASSIESFVTAAGNRPVQPITGSPAQDVIIASSSATLSWFIPTYSESAMTYEVEYSMNQNMSDAIVAKGITNFGYTADKLDDNAVYYWRVRSKTADGQYSNYSVPASFATGENITDVEETPVIPASFDVAQNYPNPFNPSTTIRISLPDAAFVSVKIYNMLGQEVLTLINEERNAGLHEILWNGQDSFGNKVTSGTYIYRVVAGNNVVTKKMILMK